MAACDRDGLLSYPVETVQAHPGGLDRLLALVAEYEPERVLIGLPRSLSGGEGPAAERIRAHARGFAERVCVEVLMVDERLTTVGAAKQLHAAGRSARRQRGVIDQAAAVAILDGALDRWRQLRSWDAAVASTTTPTQTKEAK